MITILGAGGHARVLADCIGRDKVRRIEFDIDSLPDIDKIVVGVGDVKLRKKIYDHYAVRGCIMSVRHHSAIVSDMTDVRPDVQIMAGVIIQAGSIISDNVILNTRCVVDHDCAVGAHTHIAPGAVLCGGAHIGVGCFIGANAVIANGAWVPNWTFVKAGSVVK